MQNAPNSWILRIYYSDRPGCTPHPFENAQRLKEQIESLIVKGIKFEVEAPAYRRALGPLRR